MQQRSVLVVMTRSLTVTGVVMMKTGITVSMSLLMSMAGVMHLEGGSVRLVAEDKFSEGR